MGEEEGKKTEEPEAEEPPKKQQPASDHSPKKGGKNRDRFDKNKVTNFQVR